MYICRKCGSKIFISQLQIFNKKGEKSNNKKFNKVSCTGCGIVGKKLKDIADRRNRNGKNKY